MHLRTLQPTGGHPRGDALRVMTFNLLTSTKMRRSHPWRLRKRIVARIFRAYQPDVVGTQEANLAQLHELARLLPDYEFLGEGNLSRTAAADTARNWYCAIFYRRDRVRPIDDEAETWWLSPTPDVPASQFHLGTRPRVVTWHTFETVATGRTFVMGTTHLEAVNGLARRKSARLLRDLIVDKMNRLGEQTPIFLTGDFNAVETSPEIRSLFDGSCRDGRLYDAWRLAGDADPRAGATFRGLGPWRRLGQAVLGPRRIDYVLFRPRLEVLRTERVDCDPFVPHEMARPSDHLPVYADFVLPSAEALARSA